MSTSCKHRVNANENLSHLGPSQAPGSPAGGGGARDISTGFTGNNIRLTTTTEHFMTSYAPGYTIDGRKLTPEELERREALKRSHIGPSRTWDRPQPKAFPRPPGGLLFPDTGGSPRTPQGPGISGSPRSPQGPIGPGGPRDPWPSEAQWQQGTRSLIDAIKELNKFNAP